MAQFDRTHVQVLHLLKEKQGRLCFRDQFGIPAAFEPHERLETYQKPQVVGL